MTALPEVLGFVAFVAFAGCLLIPQAFILHRIAPLRPAERSALDHLDHNTRKVPTS